MLTSFFTVKPVVAAAAAPKKAVKKAAPPSPVPPSPSPSPAAVDAVYTDAIDDDDVSMVDDSLDGGGEVLETPVSDCADKDFPDTLSDVSADADDAAAAAEIDDDIFTLLRTQSRRSLDRMSGPELCCDDEDF